MRELQTEELNLVSGGYTCTPEGALNSYNGINNPSSFGNDMINFYEGLVATASHIIERVANAW